MEGESQQEEFYPCKFCDGKEGFSHLHDLEAHAQECSSCPVPNCETSMSDPIQMMHHLRNDHLHHDYSQEVTLEWMMYHSMQSCSSCGLPFFKKGGLSRHELTCDGIRRVDQERGRYIPLSHRPSTKKRKNKITPDPVVEEDHETVSALVQLKKRAHVSDKQTEETETNKICGQAVLVMHRLFGNGSLSKSEFVKVVASL